MSESLTVGVVGHVDHGKTALVRALTGTETDRLREERERGLSIVLGFAYLETEQGVVDLIDVPGHEDFIRAMISGATAIDGIMLCVAANEGVMPQTREHFNIARLLGVDKGFVVVTKTDLVDSGTLELVREEIREFVRGTFLEGSPVIAVSATTGANIEAVQDALAAMSADPIERDRRGRFFLPLDRVFTMRGFGVVATGTLRGGELKVGDTVEIAPAGRTATVRALQNHNQSVERASPGQRVAVNLRQIDRDELRRGDVLASPGSVRPSRRIDVELSLLDDAVHALKNGATVRCLTGTSEAIARLRLLDSDEIAPGATGLVQLRLDREIATVAGEHFLIRSYSPMQTIGGGQILDASAERHRRFDAGVQQRLRTAASGDRELVLRQRLAEAGTRGIGLDGLAAETGIDPAALEGLIGELGARLITGQHVIASGEYEALIDRIVAVVQEFHAAEPFRKGIDIGTLRKRLEADPDPDVLRQALRDLEEQGKLRNVQEILSVPGHDPFATLSEPARKLIDRIEQSFLEHGVEPPSPTAVVAGDKASQSCYRLLLEAGRLVRLKTYKSSSDLVLHSKALADARQAIEQEFPYPRDFALKDIRDLLGSTRKYVVPLMEHLDATGVTVRNGDLRRLRGQ